MEVALERRGGHMVVPVVRDSALHYPFSTHTDTHTKNIYFLSYHKFKYTCACDAHAHAHAHVKTSSRVDLVCHLYKSSVFVRLASRPSFRYGYGLPVATEL